MFLLQIVILLTSFILSSATTPSPGTSLEAQVQSLTARVIDLENKLNVEIKKRESLDLELQSKNDLTQFLINDVKALNSSMQSTKQTLNNVSAVTTKTSQDLRALQSTYAEDRASTSKTRSDLRSLTDLFYKDVGLINNTLVTILSNAVQLNSSIFAFVEQTKRTTMDYCKIQTSNAMNMAYGVNTTTNNRIDVLESSVASTTQYLTSMVNNSLSDANKLISERLQNLSSSSQSDSKSVVFSASGGQLSSGQGLRFMVFSNLHVNTGKYTFFLYHV
ncbi:uncharacterized protein LOC128234508 [Mya arenaria]|uniref:uncharacterized protein LOC128234508 n=1 Tax=Mya arenaria TaxID=6604 RepID=UPI0022E5D8F5|nr:uncharacterized protein LOC128234508 [Mya arenaria]